MRSKTLDVILGLGMIIATASIEPSAACAAEGPNVRYLCGTTASKGEKLDNVDGVVLLKRCVGPSRTLEYYSSTDGVCWPPSELFYESLGTLYSPMTKSREGHVRGTFVVARRPGSGVVRVCRMNFRLDDGSNGTEGIAEVGVGTSTSTWGCEAMFASNGSAIDLYHGERGSGRGTFVCRAIVTLPVS